MKELHPLVTFLRAQLEKAGDPGKAVEMRAYMKTDQPFYGVPAGPRRIIFRNGLNLFGITSRREWESAILDLWNGKSREEMYLALDLAERFRKYRTPTAWPLFKKLVYTAPNWDTLDWIAAKLVGELVMNYRQFEQDLVKWRSDEILWVRRAAILAHLKHKEKTNLPLLSETILFLSWEDEFFIRKAIGWVLREYAKTDPEWVLDFVNKNENRLSSLSKREALKNIT